MDDPAAAEPLAGLDEGQHGTSWHLVEPGRPPVSRGAGVSELLRVLGQPGAAALARRLEGPLDHLYALVSDHRRRLGRFVPDGPAPRSFP